MVVCIKKALNPTALTTYRQISGNSPTKQSAMLKLIVCILLWAAVCYAQEQFTCLRIDNALTQQSPQTTQKPVLGNSSKGASIDQKSERGYPLPKAVPVICDNVQISLLQDLINSLSQEIRALKNQSRNYQLQELNSFLQEINALKHQSRENQFQEQLNALSQEIESLNNQSRENQLQKQLNYLSREVESLKNQSRENSRKAAVNETVHVPTPVYVYKLNPNEQTWKESRKFCQNWGGDLAVHGVRTLEGRRRLIQYLGIIDKDFWIGAVDLASEGRWYWLNGEPANSSELIWGLRQPDGNTRENCVVVAGRSNSWNTNRIKRAYDQQCDDVDSRYQGVCEKES